MEFKDVLVVLVFVIICSVIIPGFLWLTIAGVICFLVIVIGWLIISKVVVDILCKIKR